jgi:hypothetical protein
MQYDINILDVTGDKRIWLTGIGDRIQGIAKEGYWDRVKVSNYQHGEILPKANFEGQFFLANLDDRRVLIHGSANITKILTITENGIEMHNIPDIGLVRSANKTMQIENWERE